MLDRFDAIIGEDVDHAANNPHTACKDEMIGLLTEAQFFANPQQPLPVSSKKLVSLAKHLPVGQKRHKAMIEESRGKAKRAGDAEIGLFSDEVVVNCAP